MAPERDVGLASDDGCGPLPSGERGSMACGRVGGGRATGKRRRVGEVLCVCETKSAARCGHEHVRG
jgi:hypothetical protein